jgi:hypothetical protein
MRQAMPHLRERQHESSREVDGRAKLATTPMKAYLQIVQRLEAAERRIRFAE